MPVCSYVVLPREGMKEDLSRALSAMPECEVVPADDADLLLLVTTTSGADEDAAVRARVEELPEIQALLLTFGEIDPGTPSQGSEHA